MFGGISSTLPLSYSDELWSYRRTDNSSSWALMPPGSSAIDRPTPRVGSALCAVGHFIYVYGGASFAANAHADLYRFDTAQRQWLLQLPPGTAPGALAYHAMSCVGGTVYLSGGEDASGTLRSSTYALLDAGNPAERLYVFGGADALGSRNDVVSLDLSSLIWSYPAAAGTLPTPRWGTLGAKLNEKLYVYGGLSTSSQLLGDMWSMSRQCHGRVHLRASRATFASGEGVYGPNARCEWLIAPTAPDRQVRLFFSAFGLEDGADYVRVYDGTEASRPLLAAFTGQGLPQSLVSSNGSLLVVMTTDGSTQDVGFRASYSSECAEGFRPSFTNPTTDDTCYPCSPGAHAASECLCYVGFHSPGGLGTGCVACPNGAECPGGASEAIVHVGFCRYNATHTKPCCEPDQCRGGTDAVCPTDVGAAGADECVEFLILTFGVNTFIIVCAVVLGAALCMGLLTYYFGRRAGIAYGLRDYMRQLHLSSVGPKLGSEIHAYTSNFEMQTQAPSNRRRGFEVLERITEEPAGRQRSHGRSTQFRA
ncbi:kelch motif family [Chrysochromulina tobinii]|uniref:Kelch motif family n=1 Tax=Chrysochromulina tobinii TaxID=1460289 RepID=A0A0M0J8E8_9EUKA|nr:kelch motif family [Chrysochromulina tobinii]|eukprot:KOO22755.1 kelch motif family [Chrysochromulina sp. CCMP291]